MTETATETVVRAADLTRRYGEGDVSVDALRGVSLEVKSRELVAVMGPSGSGKSTLMHILAGLDKPTSGDVWIDGQAIAALDDTELTKLRRRSIGFIFQFFNLLPMLDAEENVVLPLSIAGEKPDSEWVDELLEKTGLKDRRRHRPSELSGGQQQRAAIARAIATEPAIILADEPTGNLDTASTSDVLDIFHRLNSEGRTIVMITHEHEVAAHAKRVIQVADGRIVADMRQAPVDGPPPQPDSASPDHLQVAHA
jgi:putative ABC transport system ATP-binding protein